MGQIVVDRGQVAAPAGQRIQVHGQRGRQRLPFAGLHLHDRAVKHGDAAEDLDVERAHLDGAAHRLTGGRKDLREGFVHGCLEAGML